MSFRRARDLLGAMAAFAGTDNFEEARAAFMLNPRAAVTLTTGSVVMC